MMASYFYFSVMLIEYKSLLEQIWKDATRNNNKGFAILKRSVDNGFGCSIGVYANQYATGLNGDL